MFYQFLPLDLQAKLISKPHWCLISQREGGKMRKNNAIFAWWCNFHVRIVCGRWGLPLCSYELQDVLLGRSMWRDARTRQNFVNCGRRSFWSASRTLGKLKTFLEDLKWSRRSTWLPWFFHLVQDCLQAKFVGEFWGKTLKSFPETISSWLFIFFSWWFGLC